MALSAGSKIGPYEILDAIGAGAMGEVYKARDTRLSREVAIKVLPPYFAQDRERLRRFEVEARASARLNHPNIVAIYDFGSHEGTAYLVTELLEGRTLRDELPLPRRKALEYAWQIAQGLAAAHAKGVTHRDLKPANLFVTGEGRVKILDFGLAKVTASEFSEEGTASFATRPGIAVGTVGYMSPEQARGQNTDYRSDIFSFGVVLYEMISGLRPFQRESAIDILNAILKEDPPPLNDNLVEPIVRRCLEKNPDQRFQSTSDLAFAIQNAREMPSQAPSSADPGVSGYRTAAGSYAGQTWDRLPSPPDEARTAPGRRATAAISLLVTLVAGAALGLLWHSWRDSRAPAWTAVRLGGSEIAYQPRISPDGHTLAFLAMVDGLTQVAVLNPNSGNWSVLTHDRSKGLVSTLCWSRDGAKIYYNRLLDVPNGVYSVPALGGDEQLVLEDAGAPEALPDGTLAVTRVNTARELEVHRFDPRSGRLEPLGFEVSPINGQLRVFPDGKEGLLYGQPLSKTKPAANAAASKAESPWHYYALNLATSGFTMLAPESKMPPLVSAATASELSAFVAELSGDAYRLLEIPRGSTTGRPVLMLTGQPWGIDIAPDGSIYIDQVERPIDVLRFSANGGAPERVAGALAGVRPVQLSDGRILVSVSVSGRDVLMASKPGNTPTPFVQTEDETWSPTELPASKSGNIEVAFLTGRSADRKTWQIAIASARDGRIVRRLNGGTGAVSENIAVSPDGVTLYYVAAGAVWSVPTADGAPSKITEGDAVAADPNGRDLIVLRHEKEAAHLYRVPLHGGASGPAGNESMIPFSSDLRLRSNFAPDSVNKDGRILVDVQALDSWWDEPGILDPRTGKVERLKLTYFGDIFAPSWTPDGHILGRGQPLRASLWRFRKENR
jgi:eukaryotic-like serine/threonine-protein kinase